MGRNDKKDFTKDLVELLLNYEEDEQHRIIIERQAFQQILLYILQEEMLDSPTSVGDETRFQQELSTIQDECKEILYLLKRIG